MWRWLVVSYICKITPFLKCTKWRGVQKLCIIVRLLKLILLMGGILLTKPFICCIFSDVNIKGKKASLKKMKKKLVQYDDNILVNSCGS